MSEVSHAHPRRPWRLVAAVLGGLATVGLVVAAFVLLRPHYRLRRFIRGTEIAELRGVDEALLRFAQGASVRDTFTDVAAVVPLERIVAMNVTRLGEDGEPSHHVLAFWRLENPSVERLGELVFDNEATFGILRFTNRGTGGGTFFLVSNPPRDRHPMRDLEEALVAGPLAAIVESDRIDTGDNRAGVRLKPMSVPFEAVIGARKYRAATGRFHVEVVLRRDSK